MQLRLAALESTLKKNEENANFVEILDESSKADLEDGEIVTSLSDLEQELLRSWVRPDEGSPSPVLDREPKSPAVTLRPLSNPANKRRPNKTRRRGRRRISRNPSSLEKGGVKRADISSSTFGSRTTDESVEVKQRTRLHRWQQMQREKILR